MSNLPKRLPRLLYIADLPVAPTQAGAVLLHRLLEHWPAEKLMICTPRALSDCPLPEVRKIEPPKSPLGRLFHSRVAYEWMTLLTLRGMAMRRARRRRPPGWLAGALTEFAPEAVLTVGLAGAWMEADAVARHLRIPLHVIVHDDHHYAFFWTPRLRPWGERLFGEAYRRAISRLCISGPMEREYHRRFGVRGQVLLPSRGRDSVFFREPRTSGVMKRSGLKVFYAGSVYGRAFKDMEAIATTLHDAGNRLIVYTPNEPAGGFLPVHLEIRRPLPSAELVRQLHEEADVLLLLGDFDPEKKETVQTQFPSKLVDYTAAAVPILVVAPEYSCVTDYVAGRPDVAILLFDGAPQAISAALNALVKRRDKMDRLARGAVAAGMADFGYERAYDAFCRAMMSSPPQAV